MTAWTEKRAGNILQGAGLRAWLFLSPALLLLGLMVALPVIGTLVTSFFRDVTFAQPGFVGLDNYIRLLSDPAFHQALVFTVLFVVVSVPLEIGLGLAMALILNRPLAWQGLLRATVLIPWAIPAAVSGRVWELIYNYNYGLANALLGLIDPSGGPVNWLGSPMAALAALVLTDVWKTTPFVAFILLAGLTAIPRDCLLQARVDGAGPGQRLVRIILPLLKPVLVVALLFRTIDALRLFDLVKVLTGGGPGGATTSLSVLGSNHYLAGDFGYGSAISAALFLLALGLAILYVRAGRFSEALK